MGPTHHAIEDYGTLLTLGNLRVCVPAFDEDVAAAVRTAGDTPTPFYLRLGRGEPPAGYVPPAFEAWRQLTQGDGPSMVVVGPLAGTYLVALQALPDRARPNMWVVGLMPLVHYPPPTAFLRQLANADALLVAEEHVARGSLASELLLHLAAAGLVPRRFRHLTAVAARFERYGSQAWLRRQAGLDPEAVMAAIAQL
jgi:transketolase